MESINLHYLMILPEVGALVTSFGKDSIIYMPGPNAMLTQTSDSGQAKRLPPIIHDFLLPLAANCNARGEIKDVEGDICFNRVTRSVDVEGTGRDERVSFYLYLFCLDPWRSVQDENLQGLLREYYSWETFMSMASEQEQQMMLKDEECAYDKVVNLLFTALDGNDLYY